MLFTAYELIKFLSSQKMSSRLAFDETNHNEGEKRWRERGGRIYVFVIRDDQILIRWMGYLNFTNISRKSVTLGQKFDWNDYSREESAVVAVTINSNLIKNSPECLECKEVGHSVSTKISNDFFHKPHLYLPQDPYVRRSQSFPDLDVWREFQ